MDRGIITPGDTASAATQLAAILGVLEDLDLGSDDDRGLVDAVSLCERLKGVTAALQARASVQLVDRREGATECRQDGEPECRRRRPDRSVRAELALARRCSPAVMDRHIGVAKALVGEMPWTMELLSAGRISERQAFHMVARTACLTREDRAAVDEQLAPGLPGWSERQTKGAAERAAAERDNAAIARRHAAAVKSRRLSISPAPDGMAWLSILGPMVDVIGAHAALIKAEKARHVSSQDANGGSSNTSDPRGKGAWLVDTALELLSGRAAGQPQPVAINLVMTDQALLWGIFGEMTGVPDLVEIPGWGTIAGSEVRARIAAILDHDSTEEDCTDGEPADHDRAGGVSIGDDADQAMNPSGNPARERHKARVWLRRLHTSPDGRDLVAMDSKRRTFTGSLRQFLELRDPTCRVPYCDAPAIHVDHATGHAHGAPTSAAEGNGQCAQHNLTKEEPG